MTRQNIDEKRWGDTLTLQGGQMGGLPISPPSKTIISFSILSLVRRFSKNVGGNNLLEQALLLLQLFIAMTMTTVHDNTALLVLRHQIEYEANNSQWSRRCVWTLEFEEQPWRGGYNDFRCDRGSYLQTKSGDSEHYRSHWKSMYQDWRQYHYCSYWRTNATISSWRW